ncbi:hypothetical protein [Frateuria sp. STR12]|uniref:hypothetical protein n=1 Tax=Frateuria hangzhouensis TaxID=2995589 RepID=UPI002260847D|nr:hypothetical protein [Frateuria sp. STR12]MCX7514180.1 hypothetical protein [Frateuria sp. STR12]
MKCSLAVPCFLLLLASACTAAKEAAPAAPGVDADSPAEVGQTAAGVKVPPEMNRLYPRIGKWQATIRTLPSAASPQGGVDNGIMAIEKGPGGFSIVQNFRSRGISGHVIGQGYTWWDTQTSSYKSVWCDNVQGCTEFTTAVLGRSWTVELDGTANGRKVHTTIRATMSPDRDCIHEEFANAYDGGPPRTETVSEYRRIIPGMPADKQPSCQKENDSSPR